MTEIKLSHRLRTGVSGLAGLGVVSALGVALGLAPASPADPAARAATRAGGSPAGQASATPVSAIRGGPVTAPTTAAPDATTSGS